ncbi:prepilin-type N-terminal cleavage/methylation domain-containing protein [Pseudomonas sp. 148P]|uniref:Type II secretion system protein J n=1 Tax=Pseudomonas ulcerans TaxID=3115852 RepID=A0ABU7HL82_9PSED|nr:MULTISPECIES: prepilin-type N-terminal cleavage/methylation domain-containing protein [unclassified Pseudomonas]MEE1920811.1 prepilin-type N-terminal cleavage/methylation domain-containing protein [Pseudomonas sp. 147P]MEE1932288.1 prepilin-type N-terminal cleavage/methylation domain-containing protein [Pseudomonas sp. 148P]
MCRCAEARKRQSGFTLIEVMVAILLMALVSLIAWRGLDSIGDGSQRMQRASEQSAALDRALKQLQRDLELRAEDRLGNLEPPVAALRRSDDGIEVIRLVTQPPGALQRVRWLKRGDQLYRATGKASVDWPLAAPRDEVKVLDQVRRFAVRGWSADKGWGALGDGQPTGVEVVVERSGGERYRRVLGSP